MWKDAISSFGLCQIEQQKNSKKEIHLSFDGCRPKTVHTSTNQKHAGVVDYIYERRCNLGGVCRGGDSIVLGAIEDEPK